MNQGNNTFYLNYLYFKHINIAKEKCEEKGVSQASVIRVAIEKFIEDEYIY